MLRASRYTDRVDVLFDNPVRRLQERIKAINGVLGGILVACNYRVGGEALDSGEFEEHTQFFQTVFEIARRYKILNPERMRSEYGACGERWMEVGKSAVQRCVFRFEGYGGGPRAALTQAVPHHLTNPPSSPGKLLYFLQDTMDEEVMDEVGVCVVKPIKTVYVKENAAAAGTSTAAPACATAFCCALLLRPLCAYYATTTTTTGVVKLFITH